MHDVKGLWIPIEILSDKELTLSEKLVAAEIYILAPCNASNNHIGNILNMNKRQVMRIIKNLEEKGWIKTTYLSPVRREINTTKNVTSDINGTSDKSGNGDKNGTTKNVTQYQKCHHNNTKNVTSNSDKSGTNSTKNVTQENRENNKNIEREYARAREDSPTAVPDEVLKAYQDGIRPVCSSIELEKLADDVKHFGSGAVVKAIERAVVRNKRSLSYVEGILKSWETDGYDAAEKDAPKPEPPPKIVYEDETPEYQEWLERQKLIEDIKKNGAAHYPEWLPKEMVEEIKNGARQNQES
ncbi:DnaD domain protein [Anaerovibrio sp. RM50]|uniref:DnaD domain protein n=1 Tax=Anaerovibrio sp. RM50 TaxID=1200557 RepID=UPI000482C199|nr:DnaD domain protein [Anaerovibrio sp. RM50]